VLIFEIVLYAGLIAALVVFGAWATRTVQQKIWTARELRRVLPRDWWSDFERELSGYAEHQDRHGSPPGP
jgi:hypothetical protein